jgi:hypothetical protein
LGRRGAGRWPERPKTSSCSPLLKERILSRKRFRSYRREIAPTPPTPRPVVVVQWPCGGRVDSLSALRRMVARGQPVLWKRLRLLHPVSHRQPPWPAIPDADSRTYSPLATAKKALGRR